MSKIKNTTQLQKVVTFLALFLMLVNTVFAPFLSVASANTVPLDTGNGCDCVQMEKTIQDRYNYTTEEGKGETIKYKLKVFTPKELVENNDTFIITDTFDEKLSVGTVTVKAGNTVLNGAEVNVDGQTVTVDLTSVKDEIIFKEVTVEVNTTTKGKAGDEIKGTFDFQVGQNKYTSNNVNLTLKAKPLTPINPINPVLPKLEQQVNGSKSTIYLEENTVTIKTISAVPTNLNTYTGYTITETFENGISIKDYTVRVGDEDITSKSTLNGQDFNLSLTREDLDKYSGKAIVIEYNAEVGISYTGDGVTTQSHGKVTTKNGTVVDNHTITSNKVVMIPKMPDLTKQIEGTGGNISNYYTAKSLDEEITYELTMKFGKDYMYGANNNDFDLVDEIAENLTILGVETTIDGEQDTVGTVTMDGNTVRYNITGVQSKQLEGKELKVRINVKLKDNEQLSTIYNTGSYTITNKDTSKKNNKSSNNVTLSYEGLLPTIYKSADIPGQSNLELTDLNDTINYTLQIGNLNENMKILNSNAPLDNVVIEDELSEYFTLTQAILAINGEEVGTITADEQGNINTGILDSINTYVSSNGEFPQDITLDYQVKLVGITELPEQRIRIPNTAKLKVTQSGETRSFYTSTIYVTIPAKPEPEPEPNYIDIEVVKQWVGKVGEQATIELLQNGRVIATDTLTADKGWETSFNGLDDKYTYSIREKEQEGYKSSVSQVGPYSYKVVNTEIEETDPTSNLPYVCDCEPVGPQVCDAFTVNVLGEGIEGSIVTISKGTELIATETVTDTGKVVVDALEQGETYTITLEKDGHDLVTKEVVGASNECETTIELGALSPQVCDAFTVTVEGEDVEGSKVTLTSGKEEISTGIVENGKVVLDALIVGETYELTVEKEGNKTVTVPVVGETEVCGITVVVEKEDKPQVCDAFTVEVVGEDVVGATVTITGTETEVITGTLDSEGKLVVDPLNIGETYTIEVVKDGYAPVSTVVEGSGTVCNITLELTKLPEQPQVCDAFTVTLLGEDIEGANVTLTDSTGVKLDAVSTTDGKYVFEALEVDKVYNLVVEKDGYTTIEKEIVGNETDCEISVQLEKLPEQPQVCEAFTVNVTGKDVDGAKVELKQGDDVVTTSTVKDGKVVFEALEVDKDYTVTVSKEGYTTVTTAVKGSSTVCEITVELEEEPVVAPQVCEAFTVTVTGKDVDGAKVELKHGAEVVATSTVKDGKVVFEALEVDKDYTVIVSKEGYTTVTTAVKGSSTVCEVTVEIQEEPIVEPQVCDAFTVTVTGKDVKGTTVTLLEKGKEIETLQVNDNGKAVFPNLEVGVDYVVKVQKDGYETVEHKVTGSADVCEVTVELGNELPKVCTEYTLTVVDTHNKPVKDITVVVLDSKGNQVGIFTSTTGVIVLGKETYAKGKYTLVISKDYHVADRYDLILGDDCEITVPYSNVLDETPVVPEDTQKPNTPPTVEQGNYPDKGQDLPQMNTTSSVALAIMGIVLLLVGFFTVRPVNARKQ